MSFRAEWKLFPSSGEIKVVARVHLDFSKRIKFVSFFIPRCSQVRAACVTLLTKIEEVLRFLDSYEVKVESSKGGPLGHSSELTYSETVYIYSESELNANELSSLVDSCRAQGVIFNFRGPSYLEERINQKTKNKAQSPDKNIAVKEREPINFKDDNYKTLYDSVMAKTKTPQEFLLELWKLSTGQIRSVCRYKGTENDPIRVYRARKFEVDASLPEDISQYSYRKFGVGIGRANAKDKPVFYASAGGPTTFMESRCSAGEIIVVSEFRLYCDLLVQQVGFTSSEVTSDYERLLHEIFTWPGEDLYQYTSQIAEHLMGSDLLHGLLYPSIVSNNQSHNLAIKPTVIDSSTVFINATAYKINSVSDAFNFEVDEVDFGVSNGDKVLWKGRKKQWPDAKSLKMVSSGWNWDAFSDDGKLVDPE